MLLLFSFAEPGDFPFIIRGVVLAGFPGPVKTSRAFLSNKSYNNARLLLLLLFFNRNNAILIFSCETGGKHKDSIHRLSLASPLHFVFLDQILYTAVLQMCCLQGTQLPVTPAGCFQVSCISTNTNASLTPLPWLKEQTCTIADPWSPGTVLIPNRDADTQPCHPLQGSPSASGGSCCLSSVSKS